MFYPSLNEALNALTMALVIMIIALLGYLTRKLNANGEVEPPWKRREREGDERQDAPRSEIKGP